MCKPVNRLRLLILWVIPAFFVFPFGLSLKHLVFGWFVFFVMKFPWFLVFQDVPLSARLLIPFLSFYCTCFLLCQVILFVELGPKIEHKINFIWFGADTVDSILLRCVECPSLLFTCPFIVGYLFAHCVLPAFFLYTVNPPCSGSLFPMYLFCSFKIVS